MHDRYNHAPNDSPRSGSSKKVTPVVCGGIVLILVLLANFAKVGLGAMADPTDTSYIPRPEWYFLFLFQTLKFFEGPLEVVGAVVLPTIAMIGPATSGPSPADQSVSVARAAAVALGGGWQTQTLASN